MHDSDLTLTLTNQYGEEEKFEALDIIEYQGNEYIVLLPYPDDNSNEVIIFQIEEANEYEEKYMSVDYDTTVAVFNIFMEKVRNAYLQA
ncbi:MAG: DUF1292 domain-containing protein [Erysipelotrichaceae bacterium]|nr:DUF1292 domain-containing protein [Erysipelotrichaceae bacterium]